MAGKSKRWFRIGTEGATTDGREIQRSWIEQMAEILNPEKYGARIWLEHFRGILADGPFKALGDVTALKAEEVDGKLALFAQLDPTNDLVAMNKERQKLYTSMEVDPAFADTGEAYLTGLAVTDSPASLGTEMLAFSSKAEKNPLTERKQRPENLFTAAIETEFNFDEEAEEAPGLFSKVKALLGKSQTKNKADFTEVHQAVEAIAEQVGSQTSQVAEFSATIKELEQQLAEIKVVQDQSGQDFAGLKAQLEGEPESQQRPPHSGGNTDSIDCL